MIILSLQYLTKDEEMIKKGDKFRCIKTLIYSNSDLWYQKGKIYTSDMDGCITDEDGDIDHGWTGRRAEDEIEEYFIPYISNKRGGYGRKEGKKL
jgi:hypothetical protein